MGAQQAASLGLVGDGDDSDVIRDLERAFGVDFGDRPRAWTTVGDIEADLLALYPAAEAPGLCGSAMAFRHLRAALPPAARRARPDTALASLVPGSAARRLDARLGRDGLFVMATRGGLAAGLGLAAILGGCLLLVPLLVLGPDGPAWCRSPPGSCCARSIAASRTTRRSGSWRKKPRR